MLKKIFTKYCRRFLISQKCSDRKVTFSLMMLKGSNKIRIKVTCKAAKIVKIMDCREDGCQKMGALTHPITRKKDVCCMNKWSGGRKYQFFTLQGSVSYEA